MRLEIHDGLGPATAEWDSLVVHGDPPTPFLWSWWLTDTVVGDLVVAAVYDDAGLVGGIALQRDRVAGVERLRFVGAGILEPDHLDVVARPGRHQEVARQVAEWLRSGDRVVDLEGLSERSHLRPALGPRASARPIELSPYASLPGSFEEYMAARPGQVRSTVKRARKRLEAAGVAHDVVDATSSAELRADALDALGALHDGRWGGKSALLDRWPALAAALADGLAAGQVVVHRLVHPDVGTIAVEADLLAGERTCFYQAGRLTDHEWRGSGSVLKAAAIEHAIASGHTEYDLLRGDEPYKGEWATARRPLFRVIVGCGPRGRLMQGVMEVNRWFEPWRVRRANAAKLSA